MSQRLTNEEFIKRSVSVHGDRYDYSESNYTGRFKNLNIICKVHGIFKQIPENHWRGYGCANCSGNIKWSNEKFDRYLIENSKPFTRIADYINDSTPILFKCIICNTKTSIRPGDIKRGRGCRLCANKRLHEKFKYCNEDFDAYLKHNGFDVKRLSEYVNDRTPISMQCLVCDNIWDARPGNIKSGFGCPKCGARKNEKLLAQLLTKLDIQYVHQHRINISKTRHIRVDFNLVDYNTFIEYNGHQHYKPVRFGGISQENAELRFKQQQKRDHFLRTYCIDNSISLIEIDGRKYNGEQLNFYVKNNLLTTLKLNGEKFEKTLIGK